MRNNKAAEFLQAAATNTDQATLAINRDRDALGAISLSTLSISQALVAYTSILMDMRNEKEEEDRRNESGGQDRCQWTKNGTQETGKR